MTSATQNTTDITPLIEALVADLINPPGDVTDTVALMGKHRVHADAIDNPSLRRVMAAIYALDAENIRPEYQTVYNALATNPDDLEYLGFWDEDKGQRTGLMALKSDAPDISASAYVIRAIHQQHQDNVDVLNRINQVMTSSEGTPSDRRRIAQEILMGGLTAPMDTGRSYTSRQAARAWTENQLERERRIREGQALGPSLPWGTARSLVGYAKPGEMICIQGKTGWGKSTLGTILAEEWAWGQGYDVAVFLFETSIVSTMDRIVARHCDIHIRDLQNVSFWLGGDEGPGRSMRRFLSSFANEDQGMLNLIECPGWNAIDFIAEVDKQKKIAEERGRELVVLVDYYQKIEFPSEWKDRAVNPYNYLADKLKTWAEQRSLVFYVLAQEKEDTELPLDGTNILKRSQVNMRIQRYMAGDDLPMFDRVTGEAVLDATGRQKMWHVAGSWSTDFTLQVTKANDGQTGRVNLRTAGGYFTLDELITVTEDDLI